MSNNFVAGDTGSAEQITCRDKETGAVIDLTGATVLLQWKSAGALVSRGMTIVGDPKNGVVKYIFGPDELVAPAMHFEVKITDAQGKVLRSLDLIPEKVREPLA